jgi:serine/threonine protein kinase
MAANEQLKLTVSDFELLEEIGEGASGKVYKAEAKDRAKQILPYIADNPIALKLYNREILKEPNQRMRIAAEYKTGKMLVHPNLVKIYHVDIVDEVQPFLVMEWCDGDDLAQWREKNPSPNAESILKITLQMLDVLDFLHSSRRFHRDVKPTNIKIDPNCKVRLLDYGIIRELREESITVQGLGRFVGTVRYSAPEYLDEDKPRFDCTSDLYSLGAVLYFLLHGYEIYRNVEKGSLRSAKQHQDVILDLSIKKKGALWAVLYDLCKRMLERQPARRFPSGMACWDFLVREAQRGLVPLRAYFACALTCPNPSQRQCLDEISEIIKGQAETNGFSVYFPGEHTHPTGAPDLKAREVYWIDRERVAGADLLIIVADVPSFGVGQEAEIAANAGVPIVIFYSEGVKVSRMLSGIAGSVIKSICFSSNLILEEEAEKFFREYEESLQSTRRRTEREYHLDVGDLISELRGTRSIEDLADSSKVNPELLISLETRPEQISNVSLINLRRIARGLGVPPEKLVREQSPKARFHQKLRHESLKSLHDYAERKDLPFRQYEDLKARGLNALQQQVYSDGARAERVKAFQEDDWERLHLGSTKPSTASHEVDQMSED